MNKDKGKHLFYRVVVENFCSRISKVLLLQDAHRSLPFPRRGLCERTGMEWSVFSQTQQGMGPSRATHTSVPRQQHLTSLSDCLPLCMADGHCFIGQHVRGLMLSK